MPDLPPKHRPSRARLSEARGSAASRGYDETWRKLRLVALRRDRHLCQGCRRAPATCVDHIQSIESHPELRLVLSNLRSLCDRCHALKGIACDGLLGREKKPAPEAEYR